MRLKVSSDEEKRKSILDSYEGKVKAGRERKIELDKIGLDDQVGLSLSRAVQDSTSTATQVLHSLGIRGERLKAAEKIIGEGDEQAERLAVVMMAEQMRDERQWRRFTFGVSLATLLLSTCSVLVAAVSLILSVILSLIRSGGPLR